MRDSATAKVSISRYVPRERTISQPVRAENTAPASTAASSGTGAKLLTSRVMSPAAYAPRRTARVAERGHPCHAGEQVEAHGQQA